MFYLHVSNRTENLVQHLAEVIDSDRSVSIFEKEIFLIQSRGMERMLSQNLADRFGCWCNFSYLLPLGFVDLIANRLGMGIAPDYFDREVLTWRLEKLLRNLDHPVYRSLRSYLEGENSQLKRYQLARKLANIFDQYQLMRPDMLQSWDVGKTFVKHSAEKWQMALWKQLQDDDSVSPHRGVLIQQLVKKLRREEDLSQLLPGRISIFGLHSMPPLFLDVISSLALHSQIHLYLLSPCKNYWGHLDSRRRRIAREISSLKRDDRIQTKPDIPHPLLETLGRQGSEFQEMLLEHVDFELEFKSFEKPVNDSEPFLLHKIQADLLEGEVTTGDDQAMIVLKDDSIQIISAHTKIREMMILKDYILDWLHSDHTLEPRDIVVMAPDIGEYAQLIPSVFEEIPHSVSDRTTAIRNPVMAVFLDFVEMLKGRFGWSKLLELLFQPSVYPAFDLSSADFDLLRHWVRAVGIRWGLSGDHRRDLGLPDFDETSWSSGLERLLMGYAIDSEEIVDGILPYQDIEGSGSQPLGGLCRFVELVGRARTDISSPRTLAQWSRLLVYYAENMFFHQDEAEYLELRGLLTELESSYGYFHQELLEFAVIEQWLQSKAAQSRSSSGFLRGGITFCSMLPMRSIPFQCVCLIGLDNGVFPARDNYATFDLMGESHKPGDRSKRTDDRYQFLEALLAARRRFYVSYVGQSEKTNESIPPSVTITELQELLEYGYGISDIVENHPLQPFNPDYFTGDSPLVSYNEYYCQVAEKLSGSIPKTDPWWSGELDEKPDQTIALGSLLSFYANPQRWFVRERLGIRLDKTREEVKELEQFKLEGLDNYLVDQEIVADLLAGYGMEDSLFRMQVAGDWPLGTPGHLSFREKCAELEPFISTIRGADVGTRQVDIGVDLNVGQYRLNGSLTDQYEKGMLVFRYAKLKARDILHGYLYSLLRAEILPKAGEVHVIAQDRWICFEHKDEPPLSLAELVEVFQQGWRRPVDLFVEQGWHYLQQLRKGVPEKKALADTRNSILSQMKKNRYESSVREPEWQLLYGGMNSEAIPGDQFQEYCELVLEKVCLAANIVDGDNVLIP